MNSLPNFPTFKTIEVSDMTAINAHMNLERITSCEYSLVNMFCWAEIYDLKWSLWNNHAIVHCGTSDITLMPADSISQAEVVSLSDDLRSAGCSGSFYQADKHFVESNPELEHYFEIKKEREMADYLHLTQHLVNLKGQKLRKKRNLISQFEKEYESWHITPITSVTISECVEFSSKWRNDKTLGDSPDIEAECAAFEKAAVHFDELKLEGLSLRLADGTMAALSIYSRLNEKIYCVHFEKALTSLKGAAQLVNRETARALISKCQYINREQDMGVPGLRKAKRSYDPDILETPYLLIRK